MWERGSIDKTSKICRSAGWFQLQQNLNLAKYVALLIWFTRFKTTEFSRFSFNIAYSFIPYDALGGI